MIARSKAPTFQCEIEKNESIVNSISDNFTKQFVKFYSTHVETKDIPEGLTAPVHIVRNCLNLFAANHPIFIQLVQASLDGRPRIPEFCALFGNEKTYTSNLPFYTQSMYFPLVYLIEGRLNTVAEENRNVALAENLDQGARGGSRTRGIRKVRFNPKALFASVLAFHIIVYLGIGIFVLIILNPTVNLIVNWNVKLVYFNDYNMVWKLQIPIFLSNPTIFYTVATSWAGMYARELPFGVVYFLLFFSFPDGGHTQYITLVLAIFGWNLLTCFLIKKVLESNEVKGHRNQSFFKSPYTVMAIFLLTPWQWVEYFSTQTNIIAGCLVLAGLYFYLKKKQAWAFFLWALAVSFKLFPVFLLALVLFSRPWKPFLKNCLAIVAGLAPSGIFFLVWPVMLPNYVSMLIYQDQDWASQTSGSFARNLTQLINLGTTKPVSVFVVVIFMVLILLPLTVIMMKEVRNKLTIVDWMMVFMLLAIAVLRNFSMIHIFVVFALYLVWLAVDSPIIPRAWKLHFLRGPLRSIPLAS